MTILKMDVREGGQAEKASAGTGEERGVAIGGTGRWDLLLVLPCKSFLAGTLGLLATPYCAAGLSVRLHCHLSAPLFEFCRRSVSLVVLA
ncbi:MAG: hypothetical protein WA188_05565 [Terriglobales bacterium]